MAGSAAALLTAAMVSSPAQADGKEHGGDGDPSGVTVVASGLNGPRQISDKGNGPTLLVAESDAGRVSSVSLRNGTVTPVVSDLGQNLVQGVDWAQGRILVAIGEPGPDGPPAPPSAEPYGQSVLLGARGHQTPIVLADLAQFELDNNPDGQPQFGADGAPLDALSNPYFVLAQRNGNALIADAGGNDIIQRTRKGTLRLWKVLPLITDGACADVPNNDPKVLGCDPVPTGLAYGGHDELYVSALASLVPGAGKVFVFDQKHDGPIRVIDGLTSPTGVEVDAAGNVYVSELLEGAPAGEGPPPAGFDPSTIGQIVKIAPDGTRTYAQVTMPAGLLIHKGILYASAWSVAGLFLGIPDRGEIVRVDDSAFAAAPESS
ncbi:MAG: ScyD/ScyE family protein [Nakamurella sp.]